MKIVKKIKIFTNNKNKNTFDFWLRKCKTLYNVALDERKFYYQATGKSLSLYTQKKELVDIKQYDPSYKDVPNKALQEIIFRLDKSFKNFFRGNGYPKYKNDDNFNSIEFVRIDVRIKNKLVYLPKIKTGIKGEEEFPLNFTSVKLIRENDNYFLGFICDILDTNLREKNTEVVGCDLGLKTLMTDSNGYEIKRFNINLIKKYEKRIKELNISLSKKKKGSNKRKKVKKHLKKTYLRLKNSRLDYLHKESTKYIDGLKEDVIALGKLEVKDLMLSDGSNKQKNFSRSYGRSAISLFANILEYKSKKKGKDLYVVDEHYTSKTCSCCGEVKYDLKVSDRVFNCNYCGIEIPRDQNGGLNIRKVYLNEFKPKGVDLNKRKEELRSKKKCSVRATSVDGTDVCPDNNGYNYNILRN